MPRTTTEVYRMLRPLIQRQINESAGNSGGGGRQSGTSGSASVQAADYLLYVAGGSCYAQDGSTGRVAFSGADHSTVIQAAIDAAGVGGVLAWRPGDYDIGTVLQPKARQSWHLPFHAVFRPTGNNRIIQAVGVDWWCIYGTLHIEDTDRNTSSVEAIYLDAVNGCYFQDIMIWDYYRGVALWGTTGRSYENVFENVRLHIMRYEGLVIKQEVGDNYFNNVFIKGPSTVEWATGSGLVIGLYSGVGTIFGGIMFGRVEVLDCTVNVDLQGLYECWFDQILSDNAFFAAVYIGAPVQRLFVGTIWAAGSGEGLWIQGDTSSNAKHIRINQVYAWINAQRGIHLNGYIEDVHIGMASLVENQVAQLQFSRGNITNVRFGTVNVSDSNDVAIDAGGVDSIDANVSIGHVNIDDGECMGLDLLYSIDGVRDGKLFQNRGVAYVLNGTSYITVTHGLEGKPLFVNLTAHHYDARQAFVSTLDATNFIIDASYTVGADARVAWVARSGVEIGAELLLNPDVDTGSVTNWVAYNGAYAETSDVYNGSQALRIDGGFHEWKSDPFTAVAGERYRIHGYIKGVGNAFAELTIRFWDVTHGWLVTGYGVVTLTSTSDYVDGYVRVQGDFTAPASTEAADLLLHNIASNTTDVYADDFFFGLPAGSNLLSNVSVETGSPDNWTLDGVTHETGTARTGTKSLRVTNSTTTKEAQADWVNVSPSTAYELSVYLQGVASGNVALVVQWYSDAGGIGNLIKEDAYYINAAPGTWTQYSTQFTAPATAQSAYFVWRMVGWTAYDLKGDGFSVKQLI